LTGCYSYLSSKGGDETGFDAIDRKEIMKIAFASGKGGTGKTTIAVNLAWFLAHSGQPVQYLDCDVEEPNGHIFLNPKIERRERAGVMVPVIDQGRCVSCGKCGEVCEFSAIVNFPSSTLLIPPMCHGCGLCALVCPNNAISEGVREIGLIETGTTSNGIPFVQGILDVGEPMANPLIEQVKARGAHLGLQIVDAPPGTSCPVVKTIFDADLVVLVTEPTPFGLHDLKIVASVASSLGVPTGVVVNREQGIFEPLEQFLEEHSLPVLARFPEDREIATTYSEGTLICKALPMYRVKFRALTAGIGKILQSCGENKEWQISMNL
jgi:MinD superfamily P-loop ATPase